MAGACSEQVKEQGVVVEEQDEAYRCALWQGYDAIAWEF